jgi:hypothetical protein
MGVARRVSMRWANESLAFGVCAGLGTRCNELIEPTEVPFLSYEPERKPVARRHSPIFPDIAWRPTAGVIHKEMSMTLDQVRGNHSVMEPALAVVHGAIQANQLTTLLE